MPDKPVFQNRCEQIKYIFDRFLAFIGEVKGSPLIPQAIIDAIPPEIITAKVLDILSKHKSGLQAHDMKTVYLIFNDISQETSAEIIAKESLSVLHIMEEKPDVKARCFKFLDALLLCTE